MRRSKRRRLCKERRARRRRLIAYWLECERLDEELTREERELETLMRWCEIIRPTPMSERN